MPNDPICSSSSAAPTISMYAPNSSTGSTRTSASTSTMRAPACAMRPPTSCSKAVRKRRTLYTSLRMVFVLVASDAQPFVADVAEDQVDERLVRQVHDEEVLVGQAQQQYRNRRTQTVEQCGSEIAPARVVAGQ